VAVLEEAQSWGLNPWDNRLELMELVELWRHLEEAEMERVIEAGRLANLVWDISKVLVDLGMPPIPGFPQDPRIASSILEAAGTILEHLWEDHVSGHDPWD
jgi:hypothetical protein